MKKLLLIFCFLISLGIFSYSDPVESPYFSVETDRANGFNFSIGGSSTISNITFLHDFYYYAAYNSVEPDFGPIFSLIPEGKLDVALLFGPFINLNSGETEFIYPQLYLYSTINKLYLEGWFLYEHGTAAATKDLKSYIGRYIARYSFTDWLAMGPHFELKMDLSDNAPEDILTQKIGVNIRIPYGKNNTFTSFLGVDTKDDNRFFARFNFTHNF